MVKVIYYLYEQCEERKYFPEYQKKLNITTVSEKDLKLVEMIT